MSVFLVGAGCGKGGISLRGLDVLRRADCVVYDDLLDEELLSEVKASAEKIYVGKRQGAHSLPQEEINELLLSCSRKYPLVVRLKGGDPYVFGRGGEEGAYLAERGVAVREIPATTSAISAPALAGIPVTHRGAARSFHVYTAHVKDGTMPDFAKIAKTEGTHVFLMGHSRLKQIVRGLLDGGMDGETPCALVSNAGMVGQKAVYGKLSDILSKSADMLPPSVFIVGMVCSILPKEEEKKIAVVGTKAYTEKVRRALYPYGIAPQEWNIFSVQALPFGIEEALSEEFSVFAFSSSNGVRCFFEGIRGRTDFRKFSEKKFAVIGAGTGETLKEYGFFPDYMPEIYDWEHFEKVLSGAGRVALFGEKSSPRPLPDGKFFPVYSLVGEEKEREKLREELKNVDLLALSSPSAARETLEGTGFDGKIVCIGKPTYDTVKSLGFEGRVAQEATANGLAKEIALWKD